MQTGEANSRKEGISVNYQTRNLIFLKKQYINNCLSNQVANGKRKIIKLTIASIQDTVKFMSSSLKSFNAK